MKIIIDGKEYKEEDLSNEVKTAINIRQQLASKKQELLIEVEKNDVLMNHWNQKIKDGLSTMSKTKKKK
jgi:molybdopterin converting factor small subunit